jgi:carboxymethylenebutenolidase
MYDETRTDAIPSVTGGVKMLERSGAEPLQAYVAQPEGPGPLPGIVFIAHAPGWNEWMRETSRRFAEHGFLTVAPNIFQQFGQGPPSEVSAAMRAAGGVADASVLADVEASLAWIRAQPNSNGKVGVTGPCSAGRHAVLAACSLGGGSAFDAVANLWGSRVVQTDLTEKQPVAPIDLIPQLNMPMLGIFGNDDMNPSPEHVNTLEAKLNESGKAYRFHRYDGAGHALMVYSMPTFRQQQAMDAWNEVEAFFKQNLGAGI